MAAAQVVVGSGGGGKLWSRARVCVSRGAGRRARKPVGELAAVFCERRASCAAVVVERHGGEVVRFSGAGRSGVWPRAESTASPRGASRASDSGPRRDRTCGWTRARARAGVREPGVEYTGRENVFFSRERKRERELRNRRSPTVVRAPQDGLNVFSRVWF